MTEDEAIWSLSDAESRLDDVIERAISVGPQTITRDSQAAVVVVSAEEWKRKTKRNGNLAEFFAESPLRGSGIVIERIKDGARKVEL